MVMKKRFFGALLAVTNIFAAFSGTGSIALANDTYTEEAVITDTAVFQDAVQVVDSAGKELDGISVDITVKSESGEIKTYTRETVPYGKTDDDPQNHIDGRELPSSVVYIDKIRGKAEYTIHFNKVPVGYDKPSDIIISCNTINGLSALVSSEDATVELYEGGLQKICLRKTGEATGVTGWMQDDVVLPDDISQSYYVGKDGYRYKGWHYMTEKEGVAPAAWMYFSEDNGWIYTGWNMMSVQEGEKIPHWSYFGDDGKLRTGWQRLGEGTGNPDGEAAAHWSYFGPNGWLRTNWQHLGQGTSNPDGNAERHWSYFGSNGWLRTNWQQLGKGTNNPDGNSEKHWSYFGPNGWLRTNWQQLGRGTSNPDGNAEKHWSYFGPNGWLRTGWQQLGKGTNNPDGEAEAHWSYFGNNGWLNIGERMIEGKKYIFGDDGWLR